MPPPTDVPPQAVEENGVLLPRLRRLLGDVRVLAAMASLLLSAWSVYLDDVVNNDGVLYLRAAEALQAGDWQAALAFYKWPLYPSLIAGLSLILGLGVEYSAHALNAVLTALAVVAFTALVRELGGDRKTVIAAAIVVLLYPGLNEYRSFVIRDAGYLGFYLLALLLFVREMKTPSLARRVGWVAAMLVASLFRIEGFVFLCGLLLMRQWQQARSAPARLGLLAAVAGAALLSAGALAWWSFGSPQLGQEWGRLLASLWQSTATTLADRAELFGDALHERYGRGFAYAVLFAGLVVLLAWEVFVTLTPLYAVLAWHAAHRRLVFQDPTLRRFWIQLLVLHVLVLAAILLVRQFLTGRFPVALSITLILAVPFSLAALHRRWQQRHRRGARRHWVFPLVCVLLALTALDGLYQPTDKGYLKEAGLWIKQNTAAQATLFSNDPIVLWYSGKSGAEPHVRYGWPETLALARSRTLPYDYLAVRVKRNDSEQALIDAVGKAPAREFPNHQGSKLLVFQLR